MPPPLRTPPASSVVAQLATLRAQRVPSLRRADVTQPASEPSATSHTTADLNHNAGVIGLQRARAARIPSPRDLRLSGEIDQQARLIRSVQRGLVGVSIAWERLLEECGVAADILTATRIRSFRRGVLTVQVRDASTKFELARFLRAGGESRLARLAPVSLHKVKLTL